MTVSYWVTIAVPDGRPWLTADDIATLITPDLPSSDYVVTVERMPERWEP